MYHGNRSMMLLWILESMESKASLIKAMIIQSRQPTKGYCTQSQCCSHQNDKQLYYEG